jgi:hypothetical protein
MNSSVNVEKDNKYSRKRLLLTAALVLCLLCWIALGVGLYLGAGTGVRLGLATAAALSSEAVVWVAAAVLGLRLFEARRELWRRLRLGLGLNG